MTGRQMCREERYLLGLGSFFPDSTLSTLCFVVPFDGPPESVERMNFYQDIIGTNTNTGKKKESCNRNLEGEKAFKQH